MFVIARNSSFSYKGRALDLRAVGRELGVRYVVEGSVRRAGGRVRVTTQLIDAQTGSHLWAERYDRDLKDIFSVQDEITQRIVTSLAPRIEAEDLDLAKRKAPDDMRAYDFYLKAKSLVDTPRSPADLKQARDYCDRAIHIDPSYARAHAYKALSYTVGTYLLEVQDLGEWRGRAIECAETAVALDPMDAQCHSALGEAAFLSKQNDRARDHMARARSINPNDADILVLSGCVHAGTGEPEAGLRQIVMALERNPFNPSWYNWPKGIVLFLLGEFDGALHAFNLCVPPNFNVLLWRAMTLMQLGRVDEASTAVRALLEIRPNTSVSDAMQNTAHFPNVEHHIERLRQVGLPG